MKRKKIHILITFLITVIIFSTAAICNQCSVAPSTTGVESIIASTTNTTETISETTGNVVETTAETTSTETGATSTQEQQQITYTNTQYSFSFSLPISWQGYSIIITKWEGNPAGSDAITEQGPIISIRNPKWTSENPYQDIPIMVFTSAQWDSLQKDEFHIGAAPIGPSELRQNSKYVFALPARYNYAFPTGYEEVEKILEGNPLKAF